VTPLNNRDEELLTALTPHIMEIIRQAPRYGSCGIDITFHAGKLVRIEKKVGVSILPNQTTPTPESQVKSNTA
jgi:hypothetical protein